MMGLPDDWMDDGRPVAKHIAEARELAPKPCWWWSRWFCRGPYQPDQDGWHCLRPGCGRIKR